MRDNIISFIMAMTTILGVMTLAMVVTAATVDRPRRCERCLILEYNVQKLMNTVEEDYPDYVLDVLSETDEWIELEELVSERPIVTDSMYRKLRNTSPDLPSKQL